MRSIRGIGLGILIVVAAILGTAQAARAEPFSFTGYVCYINYSPKPRYGQHGGVLVAIYNSPACAGGMWGNAQLQSVGATDPGYPEYRYPEMAFHQLWNMLIKGASAEASVQVAGECFDAAASVCQIRSVRLRPL